MLSKTLALFGLASAASAHIVMTNPVPFGSPDNSPLEASGSNFPCKGISPSGGAGQNVYKAGSTQQLAFQGGAVHGGGSCQVSVTTDLNPTRDSQWKVIKSIEGGCPARDTEGNLGDDASAEIPYKYNFDIPEEMPEGEYVLAWTWFNKVGNREMYMNCASVEINGGSGDESFLNSLPDMFVANIGEDCGTESSKDVEFPNPGKAVERLNGATNAFAAPTGGSCGAKGPSPGPVDPPTNPEPTSAPTPPPGGSPVPSPVPTPSIPGGVFITVPTTAPTAAPEPEEPTTPEQPEEPTTPEPEQPEEPTEPEVPSEGGQGAMDAGSPCSTEGTWNCVGGSSFQRCASGAWSAVMQLAAGMNCDDGQSSELKVHASAGKRSMRRSQRIRY